MNKKSERYQWFLDHIGKTIYRPNLHKELFNEDYFEFELKDERHAKALYNLEKDSENLKYFNTKEEVQEFIKLKQI